MKPISICLQRMKKGNELNSVVLELVLVGLAYLKLSEKTNLCFVHKMKNTTGWNMW